MERRGCGLGCMVALLGVLLSCFLLPYLISSIYSILSAILQVPTAPTWLWGDWINTWPLVSESKGLYMLLAEGPICCAGTLALLLVILGVVAMIVNLGKGEEGLEQEYEEEEYEYPGVLKSCYRTIDDPVCLWLFPHSIMW
jgi:hypothetical protein